MILLCKRETSFSAASDLGNQHNNGPHQDQIFDNPAALCLALWDNNLIWLSGGGGWGGNCCTQPAIYEESRTVSSPSL